MRMSMAIFPWSGFVIAIGYVWVAALRCSCVGTLPLWSSFTMRFNLIQPLNSPVPCSCFLTAHLLHPPLLCPTDPNKTSWLFCENVFVQLPSQLQNAVLNPEKAPRRAEGERCRTLLWAGSPCTGLFLAVSLRVG